MAADAALLNAPRPRVLPVAQLLGPAGMFELEMLQAGLRTLVRFTLPRRQLGWIVDWVTGQGLHCHRWHFDLLARSEASLDGFSVAGRPVPADTRAGASPVLFVARDADRLREIDALACDDWWQGLALGYPACCTAYFAANSRSFTRGYEDFLAGSQAPLPCWANALAEPFGFLLLSHLPCSAECRESRAIAAGALRHLLAADPHRALNTLGGMKRMMVYHPDAGILSLAGDIGDGDTSLAGAAGTGRWRQVLRTYRSLPLSLDGDRVRVERPDRFGLPGTGMRLFDFRGDMA